MLIDGKKIADEIQLEIKGLVDKLPSPKPCLAVILVGDHPPSKIYVQRKTKACAEVGITSRRIDLPTDTSEGHLLAILDQLNADPAVDGILLQLPLPPQINPLKAISRLSPTKDVDGLHPINAGKLLIGDQTGFVPCTPLGVKVLLEKAGVEVAGKHALILGRSNLVGKPMAAILMQNYAGANATVTITHSRTRNLKELCLMADILIAAIGQPRFVKADMVKEGSVVIDVGINKITAPELPAGYQIVGDVDFDQVQHKCAMITPVPGGIGPMTIAMLLSNTMKAFVP